MAREKLSLADFDERMHEDGYVILEGLVSDPVVERLRAGLARAFEIHRPIQERAGLGELTDGIVQHILEPGNCFVEFLEENPAEDYLAAFFKTPCIINTYCGLTNRKDLAKTAFFRNMHKDVRSFMGANPYMLNMLVMLDEFTLTNGATYLLKGSHRTPDRPTEERFSRTAERAVGPKGSIVQWNSDLWHAAGVNTTDGPRRSLAITWTRPYLKQQFDYPRHLGYSYGETLSERVRQALGYNARVPASLEEWYRPAEERMYRAGQG